jgi:hypothetical protein
MFGKTAKATLTMVVTRKDGSTETIVVPATVDEVEQAHKPLSRHGLLGLFGREV